MEAELIPLLRVQRELLEEPRGFGRFRSYLRTMRADDGELSLPLAGFNPMSKSHVADVLDRLITMEAEAVAAKAIAESARRLGSVEGLPKLRLGLVVADDAQGGWTNRVLFEAKERFENRYYLRQGLLAVTLWSSDEPAAERVRVETAAAVYRAAWLARYGLPETLGQMMRQEGMVARFAEDETETPRAEVRKVMDGHLESRHYPVQVACLYGDEAAMGLGYDGVGMTDRGGLWFAASREFLGDEDAVAALQ